MSLLPPRATSMLPAVEAELEKQVARLDTAATRPFHEMLAYHMGWVGNGKPSTGKRLRPLLLLCVVEACGEQWLRAVSAAAAVELIHNFSLVHDDIEDNSPTRRGRTTAWKRYGLPMAINVGDALFAIADLAMLDCIAYFPAETVLQAASSLHRACLALTQGQFLDMNFEHRQDISIEDYWRMIEGKTAALLSAATQIGGILGGANIDTVQHYAEFGRQLGLAFQVRDDILGIWGNESETGKSAASDLVEGKNSLPIIYGLSRHSEFGQRWAAGPVTAPEIPHLAQLLKDEGAYDFARQEAERLTAAAMAALRAAEPRADASQALALLAEDLLKRKS